MSKREQYIEKLKGQLDELNQQLDRLDKKTDQLKADSHESYEEQMRKLRALAESARQKIKELKSASEDKWSQAVDESDKVFKAFHHSYNYFKSQLK